MITLKELLQLSEQELDKLFEVLDFGEIEPFDEKNISFDVDNIKYECEFRLSLTKDKKSILEFKFIAIDGDGKPNKSDFGNEKQYAVAVKRWGTEILGVKHPLKALRNSLSMLRNYVISKKPYCVTFTANEENRQKLYKKFFERYGYLIPQYTICDKNPLDNSELSSEEFWLKRH